MKSAFSDFIAALTALREEAARLPSLTGEQLRNNRSPAHLRLNGLSVVAFSVLEDFVRRRTYEVMRWLGDQNVPFGSLPSALQSYILFGTLKGLIFSLDRAEKQNKESIIQLEGMLLGKTGENEKFVPSEYFFGRSSSNLSEGVVKTLLQVLGLNNVERTLNHFGENFRVSIPTGIFPIFDALAQKRHLAAHAFPADYLISDFVQDVTGRIPTFAACFDACLSQYVYSLASDLAANKYIPFTQEKFLEESAKKIRVIEWNSVELRWDEFLNGHLVTHYKGKTTIDNRKSQFRAATLGRGHSVLWMNERGSIVDWHNPVP